MSEEASGAGRSKWKKRLGILLGVLVVGGLLLRPRYTRLEPGEPRFLREAQLRAAWPLPPAHEPKCPGAKAGAKRVFWGDLHIHTSYSMDAYGMGTRNDPWDAYAFAQGKTLRLADGKTPVTIDRKLDFAAVTDHAEYFGVNATCFDPRFRNAWPCLGYRNLAKLNRWVRVGLMGLLSRRDMTAVRDPKQPLICSHDGVKCREATIKTWRHVQLAAHQAYKPCRFTTFVGYEWTYTPTGRHVHRNVIFANHKVPEVPYDFLNYPSVEKLWEALERGCTKAMGCDVIAIPHNPNWSDGLALKIRGASRDSLRLRARYERLVEIHQAKGNSECLHPYKDDNPGDCNFEISISRMSQALRKGSYMGLRMPKMTPQRWKRIASSYVRNALGRGLKAYATSGRNPLQLGFIASTDTHNGTPGAVSVQGDFKGSHGDVDITARQRLRSVDAMRTNPGGLVGVWAEQNTRQSIFAALKRRETFGTSGPRIRARMFQLWQASGDPCKAASTLGAKVPQGGVFAMPTTPASPSTKPATSQPASRPHSASKKPPAQPVFVVQGLQDKVPLARLDIVKISFARGKIKTQVFRHNASGASLCWAWRDEAFEADAPALWYARVLQKPTPRWSRLDCLKQNNCATHPKANQMVQQRAWTSPIWYLPKSRAKGKK